MQITATGIVWNSKANWDRVVVIRRRRVGGGPKWGKLEMLRGNDFPDAAHCKVKTHTHRHDTQHTLTHTHTPAHPHTRTHAHMHTHTNIHRCIHTLTHTHTCTHAHTHTLTYA